MIVLTAGICRALNGSAVDDETPAAFSGTEFQTSSAAVNHQEQGDHEEQKSHLTVMFGVEVRKALGICHCCL